jgi:DNA-binding ferritin-like protein (Dps family)
MKVVQWDLKNNSFLHFHRNDTPLTLQQSRKKREKKELAEFVESLPLETAERKRKIKEFVLSKSKSKEESGKLVLKITTLLKESKNLEKVDSKIDLTVAEQEVFKHDYYQTAQEFVLVFYAKNVEKIQVVFVDSGRVWIWVDGGRKVILEFSGEISGEQVSEISRMNFKIKFRKKSAENLSVSVIQEITQVSEIEKENTKEIKETEDQTEIESKTEKLVPQYVKSLKEITEFNPLENVCGILNPGIVSVFLKIRIVILLLLFSAYLV